MKGAVRLGFWTAVSTAAVAAVFAVMAVLTPARSGPFCGGACVAAPYVDVARFVPGDYWWLIPGILLAPFFVGLMACIDSCSEETGRTFGRIALSLAVIYAGIIVVDYFVQLAVVIPSLQKGEVEGLSLFTQYNPHGMFIALEVLAYLTMSAAFAIAAPALTGGTGARTIRGLFALNFVLAVAAVAGLWLLKHDLVALEVSLLLIDWLTLIAGGVLLAVRFRRLGQTPDSVA